MYTPKSRGNVLVYPKMSRVTFHKSRGNELPQWLLTYVLNIWFTFYKYKVNYK